MKPVAHRHAATALNLWAQAQERVVLRELIAAGLDAVLLDGPSLRQASKDAASPSSVDVLVHPRDVPLAHRALAHAGFPVHRRRGDVATFAREGFRVVVRPRPASRERGLSGRLWAAPVGATGLRMPGSDLAALAAEQIEAPARSELAASVTELRALRRDGMTVKEFVGVRRRTREVEGVALSVPEGVCAPTTWARPLVDAWTRAARGAHRGRVPGRGPVYLDVGTGTGVLSILAAIEHPGGRFVALDRSPRALRTARRNAGRAGARGIRFVYGDLVGPLPDAARSSVHAVVENLPSVWPHAFAGGSWRDPALTVEGRDVDGLGLIRRLAREVRPYLTPGAGVVLPLMRFQWEILEPELNALGYADATATVPSGPTSVVAVVRWTS